MNWKRFLQKLIFPPAWIIPLLTIASAAGLVFVFIKGWHTHVAASVVYALSFYTLCVLTAWCVLVLPKRCMQLRRKLQQMPRINRYLTDKATREEVGLYLSLGISLLYVLINLLFWHMNRSWWFVVLAVYYVIIASMRFLLVRYVRKNEIGTAIRKEWRRARVCACILMLVNLSLSGAVLMILYSNRGYDYPGIMIYVMAMYSFYSTIHAIVELIKYQKSNSPIMTTAKIISLCAALVSMLNLETAMFSQFGADMSLESQRLMIILTGAGISISVVTMSLLLIMKSTKEIRRKRHGKKR